MEKTVETSQKMSKPGSRLRQIQDCWQEYAPMRELLDNIGAGTRSQTLVTGLNGSAAAMLLICIARQQQHPILAVTESTIDAQDLYEDIAFLQNGSGVGHFPGRQILPYDFRAPVGEIIGRRISTLAGLLDNSLRIVIAPIRAVMEPTISKDILASSRVDLIRSSEVDLDDLTDRLITLGFRRVPLVEEVGDFARRGGLIDFFSPGSEAPVRVELFGDDIESIRHFDVATQRTLDHLDRLQVLPKREIPITQDTLEEYLKNLPSKDGDFIRDRYVNDPELPGLEWLSVAFGLPQGRLMHYLPEDCILFTYGFNSLRAEAESILNEAANLRNRLSAHLSKLPDPQTYYEPPQPLFQQMQQHNVIDLVPFKGGSAPVISFDCGPHPSLASRLDLLAETIDEFTSSGIRYVITTDTSGQAERLSDLIAEKTELQTIPPIEVANLKGGFVCRSGQFALLTDHEIFSRYHRRVHKKRFKEGVAITDYSNLTVGDYVVHTDHGIARYLGLQTLQIDRRSRDCLLLAYAENDRLYIPIEEFNRVSKYSGKDGAPSLTGLGGNAWEKIKQRTKKAIEDMAADLLKLYAQRKAQRGHAFADDSTWYRQLESAFPFEETPDQEKAIADVRRDMLNDRAMDRLICGDVGFGKTEVAVRAAFRAIDDGTQVAVLVPTTILAQQHFTTFSERMRDFPIKIGLLSRFRTRTELSKTVKELTEGKVDLVIGTHRLLSDDVTFKNLGLLIIDEEHRFGVRHKERLRRLRATVDTLAMTATPIPRTLQMALTGVRDMSLIATSPKDRLPIITEVAEFDDTLIATAILREIDRGGQLFFVHNRVETIDAMHRYLQRLLPQAKIAIAHGQMHERSLEGIMLAYLSGKIDVLLCTSIIESGLDIPNANTIIINRADRFGLAQLYQLRGRVGRSSRRAYAYLLAPPTRQLRPDAIKRLRAIESHSDLGSGFGLAMRDLEIRGAGTILGAKQSGFMEEVGYDLYNKLLAEVIAELKGQEVIPLPETRLETDIEFHLPEEYVGESEHKVDIYRRLADCRTLDDVEKIRDEITDRFGALPQSATNLFDAIAVKISATRLEIEKVKLRNGICNLFFVEEKKLTRTEVESLRRATDCHMEFSLIGHPMITLDLSSIGEEQRLSYLRGVLGKL